MKQLLLVFLTISSLTANAALVASAGSPKTAVTGQRVNFYGYVAGGTPPYTYWWSMGDGTLGGTNINTSKVYTVEGIYQVTLLVTDAAGAIAMSTTVAHITKPTAPCYLLDDKGQYLTDDKGDKLTCN